jgi:hypothetical protein
LFTETKSVTVTQRRFRVLFHTRWAPASNTILRLAQKFEYAGDVKEGKGPRPPFMRTPVHVDAFQAAMQRSPGQSTTKAYSDNSNILSPASKSTF